VQRTPSARERWYRLGRTSACAIQTTFGLENDLIVVPADERGYIVQLAHISTLGVDVPDLHAMVAALGYGIDGVLGLNFLSDFKFEIRPGERRIVVETIAP